MSWRGQRWVPLNLEEHIKYVSSPTAKVYHQLRKDPAGCVGTRTVYKTRCGLDVYQELVERDVTIPRKAIECARCMTHRLRSESEAIEKAKIEIFSAKVVEGVVDEFWQALEMVPQFCRVSSVSIDWRDAREAYGVHAAVAAGYKVRILYYTQDQVALMDEKKAAKVNA